MHHTLYEWTYVFHYISTERTRVLNCEPKTVAPDIPTWGDPGQVDQVMMAHSITLPWVQSRQGIEISVSLSCECKPRAHPQAQAHSRLPPSEAFGCRSLFR